MRSATRPLPFVVVVVTQLRLALPITTSAEVCITLTWVIFLGGPGFRGRGADTIRPRGANGSYVRNAFRAPGLRNPGDSREDKFCSATAAVDPETIEAHVDASRQRNLSAEQNTDEQIKSGAGDDSSACSVPSTNVGLQPSSADSGPVRTVVTQSSQPKRPYRERMSVAQGISAQSSTTGAYEAGPVGRARRCYMRQHQTAYGPEPEAASAAHSLVTAAIQPLAQYQPVTPSKLSSSAFIAPGELT